MSTDEWICGHVAGAMCQECYRLLAAQANELAEANLELRAKFDLATITLARMSGKVEDEDRIDSLEQALHRIEQWSQAYPLDIFPEPDLKKAAELLRAGGITIDAISAHVARHVVEGVGKIARDALTKKAPGDDPGA